MNCRCGRELEARSERCSCGAEYTVIRNGDVGFQHVVKTPPGKRGYVVRDGRLERKSR